MLIADKNFPILVQNFVRLLLSLAPFPKTITSSFLS